MNELNTALYSKLTGTTAITSLLASGSAVYSVQAANLATLPYIVFSLQGGGADRQTAHRTKDVVMFVRAYSYSQAQAGSIDAAIDAALDMKPLTVTGWTNFWISRASEFANVETDSANNDVYMAGAYYRIRIDNQ